MKNVAEWRRRGLIGLIVVAMAVGLYFGFRPRPVLVETGVVSRGPLRVALEQEGRTRVIDRYVVSAPVAGYARRIALDAGDAVSPGTPLVALEPARAEVLDARRRAEAEARLQALAGELAALAYHSLRPVGLSMLHAPVAGSVITFFVSKGKFSRSGTVRTESSTQRLPLSVTLRWRNTKSAGFGALIPLVPRSSSSSFCVGVRAVKLMVVLRSEVLF